MRRRSTGWLVVETQPSADVPISAGCRGEGLLEGQILVGTHVYVIAGPRPGVGIVDDVPPYRISFQDATPA